ncbi:MAG: Nuclear transport factor 2 [Cirrosporium novae-zelandiae]|nr:MAG: Nuclear transport factor 2 [Cirrosporium novae-zelandiae]
MGASLVRFLLAFHNTLKLVWRRTRTIWKETYTRAEQFVAFYYKTFDENRSQLAALYRPNSMLTFENSPVQGSAGIVEKLTNLPFQKVVHQVASLDAQPSNEAGGIMVMVTGGLLADEEQRPMSYTQVFQLMPDGQGSYFVFNDVFRLVYPAA